MTGDGLSASSTRSVTEQWVLDNVFSCETLGTGNFSKVWLGGCRQSGARCAVKVCDKNKLLAFVNRRQSHLSLNCEATTRAGLCHPGIVELYNWFETTASLYLVLELLTGRCFALCYGGRLLLGKSHTSNLRSALYGGSVCAQL